MTMTEDNDGALPEPAPNWALFLDIDGTILDIAPTPDAVTVPPDLPLALQEAANALGGAVALVSGRSVPWIDRVFAPLKLPTAGQHGAELRLAAGAPVRAVAAPDDLNPIRRRIEGTIKDWPGVVLEPKSFGIGVHYRLAPERGDEVRFLLEEIATDAGGRYELLPGKMLIELKPCGPTKGRVVAAFMATAPFAGRIPVFIGDDRTDEHGFKEVLARGGHAVQVGPGVSTVASSFAANPAALRSWLKHIPTAVRGAVA
jgi:trehalose 6-phosphate phosphatase